MKGAIPPLNNYGTYGLLVGLTQWGLCLIAGLGLIDSFSRKAEMAAPEVLTAMLRPYGSDIDPSRRPLWRGGKFGADLYGWYAGLDPSLAEGA